MAMTTDMGLCPHQRNEQQWMICDSILQELTTAAFELFRPENSIDDFLERMAMRLGNVVIVAVSLSGEKARLLASAGLSSGSRKLPLSAIELVQDRFPWPEVHRSDILSVWTQTARRTPMFSSARGRLTVSGPSMSAGTNCLTWSDPRRATSSAALPRA